MFELFSRAFGKLTNSNIASVFKRAIFGLLIVFGVTLFSSGESQAEDIFCYRPEGGVNYSIDEDAGSCNKTDVEPNNGWVFLWSYSPGYDDPWISSGGYSWPASISIKGKYFYKGELQSGSSFYSSCEERVCNFSKTFTEPNGELHTLSQILWPSREYVNPIKASNVVLEVTGISYLAKLVTGKPVRTFSSAKVTGGVGSKTYSINPPLPTGLSFNTSTGEISGTPTVAIAQTTYSVTVTDSRSLGQQSSSGSFNMMIEQVVSPQTITFAKPADRTFVPDETVDLSVSTDAADLVVNLVSNDANVCTISDGKAVIKQAGICSITASQAGKGEYAAAEDVTQEFEIVKVSQSITFVETVIKDARGDLASIREQEGVEIDTYATIYYDVTGGRSNAAMTYNVADSGVCNVVSEGSKYDDIKGSSLRLVLKIYKAGECSVTVNHPGDDKYADAEEKTFSFSVVKKAQYINFFASSFWLAPLESVELYILSNYSGDALTYAITEGEAFCSVENGTVKGIAKGKCTVTATVAGDDEYEPATKNRQFTITKNSQRITFAKPAVQTFVQDGTVDLSVTTDATDQFVSLKSNNSDVCTISDMQAVIKQAGICSITASQAGNDQFEAAKAVTQEFEITKGFRNFQVSAVNDNINVGATTQLSATEITGTGDLNEEYAITSGSEFCSLSGKTVTGKAVGECEITAYASEDNYYNAANAAIKIAVSKATTTLALAASNTGARQGEVVTYTATLTSVIKAGGSVSFTDNKMIMCSDVALNNGVASCDYAFKAAGTHNVSAVYSGDEATTSSNSSAVEISVDNTVEKSMKMLNTAMEKTMNFVVGNQANIIGRLNGSGNVGGGDAGLLQMNANAGGYKVAFSTSRSKLLGSMAQSRVDNAYDGVKETINVNSGLGFNQLSADDTIVAPANDNVSALDGLDVDQEHGVGGEQTRKGTYDVWTELYGSRTNFADAESTNWVGYVGAHYFLTQDSLIGIIGQYDWSNEEAANSQANINGRGWMVGPYISGKVKEQNLYYEARALWGRSTNNISPDGSYTDQFKTTRWMASGALSGQYVYGEYTINPGASVTYFEETQETYIDSLSNEIDEQVISMGEVRFGPSVKRKLKIDDKTIEASLGASGVFNFGLSDNGEGSLNQTLDDETIRARFDAGFSVTNADGMAVQVRGFYDGVGVDDYSSYGGSLKVIVPIK